MCNSWLHPRCPPRRKPSASALHSGPRPCSCRSRWPQAPPSLRCGSGAVGTLKPQSALTQQAGTQDAPQAPCPTLRAGPDYRDTGSVCQGTLLRWQALCSLLRGARTPQTVQKWPGRRGLTRAQCSPIPDCNSLLGTRGNGREDRGWQEGTWQCCQNTV